MADLVSSGPLCADALHVFVEYCAGEGVHMWQVAKVAMTARWARQMLPPTAPRLTAASHHAGELTGDGVLGVRTALSLCWPDTYGSALRARNWQGVLYLYRQGHGVDRLYAAAMAAAMLNLPAELDTVLEREGSDTQKALVVVTALEKLCTLPGAAATDACRMLQARLAGEHGDHASRWCLSRRLACSMLMHARTSSLAGEFNHRYAQLFPGKRLGVGEDTEDMQRRLLSACSSSQVAVDLLLPLPSGLEQTCLIGSITALADQLVLLSCYQRSDEDSPFSSVASRYDHGMLSRVIKYACPQFKRLVNAAASAGDGGTTGADSQDNSDAAMASKRALAEIVYMFMKTGDARALTLLAESGACSHCTFCLRSGLSAAIVSRQQTMLDFVRTKMLTSARATTTTSKSVYSSYCVLAAASDNVDALRWLLSERGTTALGCRRRVGGRVLDADMCYAAIRAGSLRVLQLLASLKRLVLPMFGFKLNTATSCSSRAAHDSIARMADTLFGPATPRVYTSNMYTWREGGRPGHLLWLSEFATIPCRRMRERLMELAWRSGGCREVAEYDLTPDKLFALLCLKRTPGSASMVRWALAHGAAPPGDNTVKYCFFFSGQGFDDVEETPWQCVARSAWTDRFADTLVSSGMIVDDSTMLCAIKEGNVAMVRWAVGKGYARAWPREYWLSQLSQHPDKNLLPEEKAIHDILTELQ